MNTSLTYLLSIFWIVSSTCTNSVLSQNSEQVHRFYSKSGTVIDVYTPPDFDLSGSYPLLLLNDGEIVFNGNSWNLAPLLNEMIEEEEIKPLIAVAIHSMGKRNERYIPYEDSWVSQNWGKYTPSSKEYADLLFKEIIPFLNTKYNILENETGIIGASLGGLVSTWLGIHYPEQIRYSASLSGSYWIADYEIFNEAKNINNSVQIFWFDIGTNEWNYYVPFYKILEDQGLTPGDQSYYYEISGGTHTNNAWLSRISIPLKIFYGTNKTSKYESMEVHLECIPSHSTPGRKFRRLNPVITRYNGITYSLAHKADFSLQKGTARIGTEGSFTNDPELETEILVTYKEFSELVVIPVNWCD